MAKADVLGNKMSNRISFFIDGERSVPVFDLGNAFANEPIEEREGAVLICNAPSQRVAFVVDRIHYQQEVVVKNLGPLLENHRFFSSATIDGTGLIVPIIDFQKLLVWFSEDSLDLTLYVEPDEDQEVTKPRILIVDDSLSVRKVCADYLKDLDVEITTANDGIDAINETKKAKFDLIFTDLEMPRLDGLELIPELRRQEDTSKVPIVVISSRSTAKHVDKAISLGATKCVSKPFSKNDILAIAYSTLDV